MDVLHRKLCMVMLCMCELSFAVHIICCAAEVVQKEGTKLASRQEFAKRVALDLFRCVSPCFVDSVNMQNHIFQYLFFWSSAAALMQAALPTSVEYEHTLLCFCAA